MKRRVFLASVVGLGGCSSSGESSTVTQTTEPTETPTEGIPQVVSGAVESSPEIDLSNFDQDTSGDGVPDSVVEHYGLDPQRQSLLIELTSVDGASIDTGQLKNYYYNVGVENSDGTTGLAVHIEQKEVDRTDVSSNFQPYHFEEHNTPRFQREWRGFRHLIVLPEDQHIRARNPQFYAYTKDGDTETAIQQLNSLIVAEYRPWEELDGLAWGSVDYTTPSTYWWEQLAGEPTIPSDDQSGDGITAEMIERHSVLSGLDPRQKNVFIEAIPHETATPETVEHRLQEIQSLFSRAPIRNLDGTMGINVHYLLRDDAVEDLDPNYFEYRDIGGRPVFIHEIPGEGGYASGHVTAKQRGNTVCHELGHLLGLWPRVSPEIDNRRGADEAEYPSCMNYDFDKIRFCADEGIEAAPNDWAVIEENMYNWEELYEDSQR